MACLSVFALTEQSITRQEWHEFVTATQQPNHFHPQGRRLTMSSRIVSSRIVAIFLATGMAIASSVLPLSSALASPHADQGRFSSSGRDRPEATVEVTAAAADSDDPAAIALTVTQQMRLVDLLRGTSVASDLLSDDLRRDIADRAIVLPSGIQKRLQRGKPLPPGIAQKVVLPTSVNSYLGLPVGSVEIATVGSNVVVLDPLTSIVVDLLLNVL
jgi:hypothetical protein